MTSPLRREQAELTRRRVLDAAHELLLRDGYAGTTITAVAERAGVAVPTVYKAFGHKAELIKRLYDRTLAGGATSAPAEPAEPAERKEIDVLAERDPHRALARYASLAARTAERLGPLVTVLLAADAANTSDSTDPQLRELVRTIEEERRRENAHVAGHLDATGGLAVPVAAARDLLWLFTAPEVHQRLVRQQGWTMTRFAEWLTDTLTAQLLKPRRTTRGSGDRRAASRTI